jgi:hypothetical protein
MNDFFCPQKIAGRIVGLRDLQDAVSIIKEVLQNNSTCSFVNTGVIQ